MDIVLKLHDDYILTPYVYPKEGWPEDSLLRQLISLTVLVNIHAVILYFCLAGFTYFVLFDKQLMKHQLFLKVNYNDQIINMINQLLLLLLFLESNSTRN